MAATPTYSVALSKMSPAEAHMEAQYQALVARYYAVQAQFYATQRECQRLMLVVRVKQEVIGLLLPYYPHPITAELQQKIDAV